MVYDVLSIHTKFPKIANRNILRDQLKVYSPIYEIAEVIYQNDEFEFM